jgi:hypothetical protein
VTVHEPATLSTLGNVITTIIVAIAVGVGGVVAYFRERKEPKTGQDLVLASATFSDRATIEHLAKSIDALRASVDRLTVRLDDEAQIRHDAKIREEAIREIIHQRDYRANQKGD